MAYGRIASCQDVAVARKGRRKWDLESQSEQRRNVDVLTSDGRIARGTPMGDAEAVRWAENQAARRARGIDPKALAAYQSARLRP